MAYVLFDLHREGASLDYPKGGMGAGDDVNNDDFVHILPPSQPREHQDYESYF